MKIKIQMVIEAENGVSQIKEVIDIERGELSAETVGLTLQETKKLTSTLQEALVSHQIVDYIAKERSCPCCGKICSIKGYHSLVFRTLFGKLQLDSPRFNCCPCQSKISKSFSPLAELLKERTAPELAYLQSKWVSLLSYGMTVNLLEEVLPLHIPVKSLFNTTQRVAQRLEAQLDEERVQFIEGCPREWGELPRPGLPITVGIDGGFVHARENKNRKAGWFEVIVGKCLQEKHDTKRFGFVTQYDKKPKRRLYDMLQRQGLQMNQAITFLSDGGDNVRDLQLYLSPQAEHIFDWFHITMRITVLKQLIKSFPEKENSSYQNQLDRIKWSLWHGNVYKALAKTEHLLFQVDMAIDDDKGKDRTKRFYKLLDEFFNYIEANQHFIPNYGIRHYYGEAISTGFVESTVNELISKRMVKNQQMRWTQKGAHLLLQVRIKTLNNELRENFCQWFPAMALVDDVDMGKAA